MLSKHRKSALLLTVYETKKKIETQLYVAFLPVLARAHTSNADDISKCLRQGPGRTSMEVPNNMDDCGEQLKKRRLFCVIPNDAEHTLVVDLSGVRLSPSNRRSSEACSSAMLPSLWQKSSVLIRMIVLVRLEQFCAATLVNGTLDYGAVTATGAVQNFPRGHKESLQLLNHQSITKELLQRFDLLRGENAVLQLHFASICLTVSSDLLSKRLNICLRNKLQLRHNAMKYLGFVYLHPRFFPPFANCKNPLS